MSKEMIEQVAAIAGQLEEQLRFYREIGVADIGGSADGPEPAAAAGSEAERATEPAASDLPIEPAAPGPVPSGARGEGAMPTIPADPVRTCHHAVPPRSGSHSGFRSGRR